MADISKSLLSPVGQPTPQCWSCGEMRAALFCDACGNLQPAEPTDYFSFFGLPRKLNLDLAALEREYYRLSRKLHPDLFANAAVQQQSWSLQRSSQLNDAYRTLREPIARTEYLLKLEGVQLEEQSQRATQQARATGEQKKVVPPELLEEVFELNMQLEELRMNRKMGDRDEDLEKQLAEQESTFELKLHESDAELGQLWNEWDALPPREEPAAGKEPVQKQVIDRMVALLNKRSYLRNLVRDVKDALTA